MFLFKKFVIRSLSISALLLSTANASTVTTGLLMDNYIGADGRSISSTDSYGGSSFDTNWMQVERVIENGISTLTVSINSNFVETNKNNGSSGIKFGDLFLMDGSNYETADLCSDGVNVGCNEYTEQTTNTSKKIKSEQSENQWEYAFDLGGNRNSSYSDNVSITGQVRDLGDLKSNINDPQEEYEESISSTTQDREWQAIMSNDSQVKNSVGTGTWKTLIDDDLLVMSFDITGTTLATVDQIALRWAMTCANDIIEVVADLKTTVVNNIPEPSTIMMMLTALVGVLLQRKKIER